MYLTLNKLLTYFTKKKSPDFRSSEVGISDKVRAICFVFFNPVYEEPKSARNVVCILSVFCDCIGWESNPHIPAEITPIPTYECSVGCNVTKFPT